MRPGLEIEEVRDGLLIRSVRRGSVPFALLGAAVSGAVVFFLGGMYFHRPALIVMTFLAAIWGSSRWWRAVRAELRVTDAEMHAFAHARRGRGVNAHIRLISIRNLEYRAGGKSDKAEVPGGLYVQQRYEANCVLPDLDEDQVHRAIDAIHRRFPSIPILPAQKGTDLSGRDAVPLNLGSTGKVNSGAHP
jgi:hypothetical protein